MKSSQRRIRAHELLLLKFLQPDDSWAERPSLTHSPAAPVTSFSFSRLEHHVCVGRRLVLGEDVAVRRHNVRERVVVQGGRRRLVRLGTLGCRKQHHNAQRLGCFC